MFEQGEEGGAQLFLRCFFSEEKEKRGGSVPAKGKGKASCASGRRGENPALGGRPPGGEKKSYGSGKGKGGGKKNPRRLTLALSFP